ncbi:MAG: glycosyltransferase family 4 protein [Candidatus Shapirobacteria bacterium]|nr:glycosyltransferase family 4 protein [Candidatus Shapirobacteria bacterium]MDD4410510.1 glycosyltransferase family 4 protein [Candidatus Shapirobacteria bacterium]
MVKTTKKILVICQHYWPENFRITDMCEGFIERGYEVDVLCGIPNYPLGVFFNGYSYFKNRKEIHNKVKINRVFEIPRKGNSNLMIFLNYISFPIASLFHLPRLLTKKYDKIFVYQLSPVLMGITGIILGKIKKIETIFYVLDLWPENLYSVLKIKNKTLKKIAFNVSTWFYKKTDKIITVSPEMETLLRDRTNKSENKITTVYQYCEKVYETPQKDKELESRFSKFFNIVFTGNLSPAQSLETITNTAILLKKNGYEDKIRFIIVGDGMSKSSFIQEIEKNNLKEMFIFEGLKPKEDIPKYTNIADVLLVTLAKSDLLELTIPAKITSYIAAAKPILASVSGASSKLIKKINCGLVSDPEDSLSLYKNIVLLYKMDKTEIKNFCNNAQKYHFKYLERNKSIDKIIKFIFD